MIRVDVKRQISGTYRQKGLPFPFTIAEYGISGQSTEPLLDACRLLMELGVHPDKRIGLFSPGKTDCRLSTTVGFGAQWTVDEPDKGNMRFRRYVAFDQAKLDDIRKAQ